jgi:glycosyltransferase involved in cell wall biosynthesis
MRVVMANITNGGLSGGYLKYLQHMIPRLRDDSRISRLDVFVPDSALDSVRSSNVQAFPSRDPDRVRLAVSALAPDVVFIPTARWMNFGAVPVMAMVRNMEPLVTPFGGNSMLEAGKNLMRRQVARNACARASRIIAVSSFVRDFLESQWSVSRDKIGVVYHGVETPLPIEHSSRPAALTELKEDRPFLFSAGSIRPARGLDDLVGALKMLQHENRSVQAVVAGAPTRDSERYRQQLVAEVKAAGLDANFFLPGSLNRAQMAWCFRRCTAFVMTTRAEACPNTALEALAYGSYVISTDAPPMPEILGESAVYYRAGNPQDLAARITETLALTEADANGRRAAAAQRANDFDWRITAERTVDELLHCIGRTAAEARV